MAKKRKKLRGTNGPDELTGTRRKNQVYGLAGDDVIATGEGKYRCLLYTSPSPRDPE